MMLNRPHNPYITDKAIDNAQGFFGRTDVFNLVQSLLESPRQNSIVLIGPRRIGKTSILLNLCSQLPSPPFIPVYFDLKGRAHTSLGQVLFELATTIATELGLAQPAPVDFDEKGRGFREYFLPSVYSAVGNNRLVLLFDEFDIPDGRAEAMPALACAEESFYPYLRDLMGNEPGLGFALAVGRKASELGQEFQSIFKEAQFCQISVLDNSAACALIGTAGREGLLCFSDDVVTRLLELTANHPYFIQLMCQWLFERAYASKPPHLELKPADVDAIVPKVLEAAHEQFEWIWDGLPPAERMILSAIAEGSYENAVIGKEDLHGLCQDDETPDRMREMSLAAEALVDWEMLKEVDGGYKFSAELMRQWVAENQPLANVKREINRLTPPEQVSFQRANACYNEGELAGAKRILEATLESYPDHSRSLALLAQILYELGDIDGAIVQSRYLHQFDPRAGRELSVRIRSSKANALRESRDENGELEQLMQILEISPDNAFARQRFSEIWVGRGDRFLDNRDFDLAIEAYSQAGSSSHVAKAKEQKRQVKIKQLEAEAGALEKQGRWNQALKLYQELVHLDPKDKRWKKALKGNKRLAARNYETWITGLVVASTIGGVLGGVVAPMLVGSSDALVTPLLDLVDSLTGIHIEFAVIGAVLGGLAGLVFSIMQLAVAQKRIQIQGWPLLGSSIAAIAFLFLGALIGSIANELWQMLSPWLTSILVAAINPISDNTIVQKVLPLLPHVPIVLLAGSGIVVAYGVNLVLIELGPKSLARVINILVIGWLLGIFAGDVLWGTIIIGMTFACIFEALLLLASWSGSLFSSGGELLTTSKVD